MAALTSTLLTVAGAAYGINEQHQATKAAKTQQRNQEAILAEQEELANEQRKATIDQQREQLGVGAYSTKSTGVSVKGTLGNKLG